jgi:LPXTG-site transpeptidase (sortase) family protein
LSSLRNFRKRLNRSHLLIFLGFFLLTFGGLNYYQVRILSFNEVPEAVKTSVSEVDLPIEIIIPSTQIDLKVEPGQIKDGVWQISSSEATFLNTSTPPGESGNTVIYGHNKKAIFGNLPYLSVGQKVSLKTQSGKIYNYEVVEKFFVGPDRVDLVSPSDHEELTIYTCWGLFDSQRAVIKAKPII